MNAVLFGGRRCVRRRCGSWDRVRLWRRRWGIGRSVIGRIVGSVIGKMIGRLFMGGADGFAPGICAVGVDVFVLGEGQGLHEGLAEIREGGGGFGFDLTLGDSGEEASEGGAEIAGGYKAAGKVIGDVLAGFLASKGLRFLAGMEGAEIGMVDAARNAAAAA